MLPSNGSLVLPLVEGATLVGLLLVERPTPPPLPPQWAPPSSSPSVSPAASASTSSLELPGDGDAWAPLVQPAPPPGDALPWGLQQPAAAAAAAGDAAVTVLEPEEVDGGAGAGAAAAVHRPPAGEATVTVLRLGRCCGAGSCRVADWEARLGHWSRLVLCVLAAASLTVVGQPLADGHFITPGPEGLPTTTLVQQEFPGYTGARRSLLPAPTSRIARPPSCARLRRETEPTPALLSLATMAASAPPQHVRTMRTIRQKHAGATALRVRRVRCVRRRGDPRAARRGAAAGQVVRARAARRLGPLAGRGGGAPGPRRGAARLGAADLQRHAAAAHGRRQR